MRLALVIYGSLNTISGGYLYDRMLIKHLQAQGDDVKIISIPWQNYPAHLAQNFQSPLRNLQGYDAILQDELNHPSLFLANQFAGQHPPIISIVHHLRISEDHPAWQMGIYRLVERAYLNSVDAFIYNGQTTKSVVEGLIGTAKPSVTAYPAGSRFGTAIPLEQVHYRATRPGPLKILFVGNIIRRKGLDTLLDALADVDEPWALTVAGNLTTDPRYAEEMQQRAPSTVTFLGAVSDEQLRKQYEQNDLLVVPSSYEGFGIVYLEAMSFGLPAIGSKQGGAVEVITHGQDGFLIDPGDSVILAVHLRALAQDHNLLLNLSLAARERFLRHPTWDQSMAKVREFIEKIVETPHTRPDR
jgi:glycosyltransferase involved in cell wall biosynthesis